jgi:hypothetical protein
MTQSLKGGACGALAGQRNKCVCISRCSAGVIEMIMDNEFRKFEIAFVKKERVDIEKNLRIVEALYHEAVTLGVLPPKNPLDERELDLKIAKVVNSIPKVA